MLVVVAVQEDIEIHIQQNHQVAVEVRKQI